MVKYRINNKFIIYKPKKKYFELPLQTNICDIKINFKTNGRISKGDHYDKARENMLPSQKGFS